MSKEVPKIRFVNFQDIWDNSSFEDAFDLSLSTNTLSRAKLNYTENGIKNIHYGDILINYGAIVDPNIDSIPTIIDGKIEKYKANLLMDGDLIFADAAEDYSVGKAVEIRGLETHYVVAGLHTIIARPKKTFSNYYLGYYINSDKFHDKLLRLVQGTKVSSLSKSSLKKTSIYYPAKQAEQQQIGLFFKKIDDLINVSQRELELLQETKKAFMQKLFPKDGNNIPDLRFEGFVDPLKPTTLNDLLIKNNMKNKYLAINNVESVSNKTGFTKQTDQFYDYHVASTDLSNYYVIRENQFAYNPSRINVGSIAYKSKNEETSVVSPLYVSFSTNEKVSDLWLWYWFKTQSFEQQRRILSEGGVRDTLSFNQLTEMNLLIPSIEEQERIGSFLKGIEVAIEVRQRKLDSYKLLKKGFLQKMFV